MRKNKLTGYNNIVKEDVMAEVQAMEKSFLYDSSSTGSAVMPDTVYGITSPTCNIIPQKMTYMPEDDYLQLIENSKKIAVNDNEVLVDINKIAERLSLELLAIKKDTNVEKVAELIKMEGLADEFTDVYDRVYDIIYQSKIDNVHKETSDEKVRYPTRNTEPF
jgi:hypothetical protein